VEFVAIDIAHLITNIVKAEKARTWFLIILTTWGRQGAMKALTAKIINGY
jgi:hypothetical protein